MKSKFIFKIFIYLILSLLIYQIMLSIVYHISEGNQHYKLKQSDQLIILGNSRPECALNDSLIEGTANLSQSGETYFYSYIKLKKLLDSNPQVNKVWVEFSESSLDDRMYAWTYGDEYLFYRFSKYSHLMTWADFGYLLLHNPKTTIQLYLSDLKNKSMLLLSGSENYIQDLEWGGYLYLERDKTDSLVLAYKAGQFKPSYDPSVCTVNKNYLEKIISLCSERKVKLCLIRIPVHPLVKFQITPPIYKKLLSNPYKNICYIDFGKQVSFDNSEFGDFSHLNHKGARKLSLYVNGCLNDSMAPAAR